MGAPSKTKIIISTTVNSNIDKVWNLWNTPEHVTRWNTASPDWHSPRAENDLREGGNFSYRMEAKDGSFGFDFEGTYDRIRPNELISFTMGDGRKVEVSFRGQNGKTEITEAFEAEDENPVDMQRNGWQAILDNFKKYAESSGI